MSDPNNRDRQYRTAIVRLIVVFAVAMSAPAVRAQRCEPSPTSNEADLLGIRSLSLAMSRGTAIGIEPTGTIRVGAEAVFLPKIDAAATKPTECKADKEGENVNTVPVAGRARISIALPRNLVFEASWLPPVELKGITANVFGVAISAARRLTDRWVAAGRGHATFGSIKGPITCPASAVIDAASECFGGAESNDTFEPNIFGGDVSLGFNAPTSRFAWFAGTGYSRLMPRFQVNFREESGFLDTTRVIVDLNRIALFTGVSTSIGNRLRGSAEFYATTRDGATGRIIVDAILRRGK